MRTALCLYWLIEGIVVITGLKVLDFYAGFCTHRATYLKASGKDITDLKLILSDNFDAKDESTLPKNWQVLAAFWLVQ